MAASRRSRKVQNDPWATATWGVFYASVFLALPLSTGAQLPPPPTGADPLAPPPLAASCAAPMPGEYALLVLSQSPEDQDRVRQALPPGTPWQLCNYQTLGQNTGVMQVKGLTSIATAQALGQRVMAATGLTVVVTQTAAIAPRPSANSEIAAYNPQPLGAGYAVLVDFANRPELAVASTRQLQAILGRAIALVSHNQRPYLLGIYTPDAAAATTLAQDLALRGFSTQVVDSSQVLVLRPAIAIEP